MVAFIPQKAPPISPELPTSGVATTSGVSVPIKPNDGPTIMAILSFLYTLNGKAKSQSINPQVLTFDMVLACTWYAPANQSLLPPAQSPTVIPDVSSHFLGIRNCPLP